MGVKTMRDLSMWLVFGSFLCAVAACASGAITAPSTLRVTSRAFSEGASIPAIFTCRGRDISPPLAWTGLPAGTKSVALICDDPDAPAGTWVHWVLYNLPASESGLPEAVPATPSAAGGALQGTNSWGKIGYGGPCPPPGKPHHYHFKVYALDGALPMEAGATKDQLLEHMKGHVLAQGELVGTFRR